MSFSNLGAERLIAQAAELRRAAKAVEESDTAKHVSTRVAESYKAAAGLLEAEASNLFEMFLEPVYFTDEKGIDWKLCDKGLYCRCVGGAYKIPAGDYYIPGPLTARKPDE